MWPIRASSGILRSRRTDGCAHCRLLLDYPNTSKNRAILTSRCVGSGRNCCCSSLVGHCLLLVACCSSLVGDYLSPGIVVAVASPVWLCTRWQFVRIICPPPHDVLALLSRVSATGLTNLGIVMRFLVTEPWMQNIRIAMDVRSAQRIKKPAFSYEDTRVIGLP